MQRIYHFSGLALEPIYSELFPGKTRVVMVWIRRLIFHDPFAWGISKYSIQVRGALEFGIDPCFLIIKQEYSNQAD